MKKNTEKTPQCLANTYKKKADTIDPLNLFILILILNIEQFQATKFNPGIPCFLPHYPDFQMLPAVIKVRLYLIHTKQPTNNKPEDAKGLVKAFNLNTGLT